MKSSILVLALLFQCFITISQVKHPLDDGRKIKIPVVFHILYDRGDVSDSLIQEELNDLNLAYSATNDMSLLDSDFQNLIGNPNIEFHLLDTLFQQNGLKGVHRVSPENRSKNLLIDPKNCLNIFVDKHGNSSGILSTRVNLNYQDVGVKSAALIHETGHWLGLYHIFGKMGNSYWFNVLLKSNDDDIDDTPPQKGATAVCYSISANCPCPPKDIYYKGKKTMYNNFMDYNPCRCMFTIGQANKMRNNVIEEKSLLFENSL